MAKSNHKKLGLIKPSLFAGAVGLVSFLNPNSAAAQEAKHNILADKLKSKEVLVNWDSTKDRSYIGTGIPVMTAQDTLDLSEHVKGNYTLTIYDAPRGVFTTDNKIITSNNTEDGIINGALVYRNGEGKITESVRLIVPVFTGVDSEKLSDLERELMLLQGELVQEEMLRQEAEEEREKLERQRERAEEEKEGYMNLFTLQSEAIRDQLNKLDEQEEELKNWTAGPYLGINNNSNLEGGLNATIGSGLGRKNLVVGLIYTSPSEELLGKTTDETRNEVPNNTGRPASKLGTDVRETTTERMSENYSLEGLIGTQISEKLRLMGFVTAGIERSRNTTTIQDYMFREREDVNGNFVRLNETLDEPKVFGSEKDNIKLGAGLSFNINDYLGVQTRATYIPDKRKFNVSGGIKVNLRAITKR